MSKPKLYCATCGTILTLPGSRKFRLCRGCRVSCPHCQREMPRLVAGAFCDECTIADWRETGRRNAERGRAQVRDYQLFMATLRKQSSKQAKSRKPHKVEASSACTPCEVCHDDAVITAGGRRLCAECATELQRKEN